MKTQKSKTKIIVKTHYPCGAKEKVLIEHSSSELTAEEMLRSFVNSMVAQFYAQECIEEAVLTLAEEFRIAQAEKE